MKERNLAIVADELKKSYKDLEVLRGVSFKVEKGTALRLIQAECSEDWT